MDLGCFLGWLPADGRREKDERITSESRMIVLVSIYTQIDCDCPGNLMCFSETPCSVICQHVPPQGPLAWSLGKIFYCSGGHFNRCIRCIWWSEIPFPHLKLPCMLRIKYAKTLFYSLHSNLEHKVSHYLTFMNENNNNMCCFIKPECCLTFCHLADAFYPQQLTSEKRVQGRPQVPRRPQPGSIPGLLHRGGSDFTTKLSSCHLIYTSRLCRYMFW